MNDWMRQVLFLPEQASTVAEKIDWLHFFVIGVTMLGAAAVGVVALVLIVRYREGRKIADDAIESARDGRGRPTPLRFEIVAFGGLLSLFVMWWVIGFRQFVELSEPPPNSMTIYVTGKQWMWSFAYPNGAGSNGVLYVPAGRPVKLVMTSRDVIHSFFVPAFRVKRDVVPGRSTMLWFEAKHPGRYALYCTEYCGTGHSTMRGEVVALTDADFERALEHLAPLDIAAAAPGEQLSLAAMGQRVAATAGCLRCHTVDGTPHIGPTWAGLYAASIPLDDGTSIVANEAYLTSSMMDPAAQVHRGFLPVMPSYQGQLSAAEVGAVVEYIRALRDAPRDRLGAPLPEPVEGNVPLVQPLQEGER